MRSPYSCGCILIKYHQPRDLEKYFTPFYTMVHILGCIDSVENDKGNGKSTIYDFVRVCLELNMKAQEPAQ